MRELQQNASAALRRVAEGETLGVTARGRLVAVLSPPAAATGLDRIAAEGRLRRAEGSPAELRASRRRRKNKSAHVLDDLRSDRV